jgi:hypothetical protein
MKKQVTLLTAMLLCATLAYSQIEKGSITLGGTFSLSGSSTKSKTSDYKQSNVGINIRPEVGFSPAKNIVIGFVPGVSFSYRSFQSTDSLFPNKNYSYTYGINPGVFVRMYKVFKPGVGFYGQLNTSFGISWSRYKQQIPSSFELKSFEGYNYNIGINPGFVWFPTEKIALHIAYGFLGYNLSLPYDNARKEIYETSHSFVANFTLSSLSVGVQFTFPPKPKAKAE